VATRREAQSIYYSLVSREAEEIMAALYRVFCAKVAKKRLVRMREKPA
jgi:hypothetical protein